MTSFGWIFIVGAVVFILALTKRPFRIFVLYALPIVAAWLVLALGWAGSDALVPLAGAVVVVELVIWLVRRRKKGPGKQKFRLAVPRETS